MQISGGEREHVQKNREVHCKAKVMACDGRIVVSELHQYVLSLF
jgi:hypothetical protein